MKTLNKFIIWILIYAIISVVYYNILNYSFLFVPIKYNGLELISLIPLLEMRYFFYLILFLTISKYTINYYNLFFKEQKFYFVAIYLYFVINLMILGINFLGLILYILL